MDVFDGQLQESMLNKRKEYLDHETSDANDELHHIKQELTRQLRDPATRERVAEEYKSGPVTMRVPLKHKTLTDHALSIFYRLITKSAECSLDNLTHEWVLLLRCPAVDAKVPLPEVVRPRTDRPIIVAGTDPDVLSRIAELEESLARATEDAEQTEKYLRMCYDNFKVQMGTRIDELTAEYTERESEIEREKEYLKGELARVGGPELGASRPQATPPSRVSVPPPPVVVAPAKVSEKKQLSEKANALKQNTLRLPTRPTGKVAPAPKPKGVPLVKPTPKPRPQAKVSPKP